MSRGMVPRRTNRKGKKNMNRKRLAPHGATCAAVLSLAAVAAAAAVSDGFPDQSGLGAATATSASPLTAFDSFAFADASAATPLTGFHSFVSQTATASPALTRFNSHKPAGFVFVIR